MDYKFIISLLQRGNFEVIAAFAAKKEHIKYILREAGDSLPYMNNITKTFTSLLSESDMPAPLHILPEYLHLTTLLLSVQYLLHAHSV